MSLEFMVCLKILSRSFGWNVYVRSCLSFIGGLLADAPCPEGGVGVASTGGLTMSLVSGFLVSTITDFILLTTVLPLISLLCSSNLFSKS